jgi:DNA repair protein RadC
MSIKEWPTNERPREKLIQHGAQSLSDAELLAIFLRVGIRGLDAVGLARFCLQQAGGLTELLSMPQAQFIQIKGMGNAKYVQLQASLELSRRHLQVALETNSFLNSTEIAKQFFRAQLQGLEREVFLVAFLNSQYALIHHEIMFTGTVDAAHVHVREVVKEALARNAAAVVLSHNHPSGSLEPSEADRHITRKIQQALEMVDIRVLDHILVGNGVVSFAELGIL